MMKQLTYTTDAAIIYHTFKSLPGSDYIASEYAIDQLIEWVRKIRPQRVLEVGSGIGTLTFTLCSLKQERAFELITIEWNDFCREALRQNLAGQQGDYQHILSPEALDETKNFDMVVIDGGEQNARFISNLAPRAVIFIEGFMDKKRNLIKNTYAQKRPYVFCNFRSPDRKKGIWIFRFEPTLSEKINFAARNFYNRIYSGIKRRLSSVK